MNFNNREDIQNAILVLAFLFILYYISVFHMMRRSRYSYFTAITTDAALKTACLKQSYCKCPACAKCAGEVCKTGRSCQANPEPGFFDGWF